MAAAGGSLIVLGETPWRLAVPGADSAAILGSGQLVVTARVTAPGRTFASASRVLLLDPVAREVADEVQLALNDAGISVIVHPRDGVYAGNAIRPGESSYICGSWRPAELVSPRRSGLLGDDGRLCCCDLPISALRTRSRSTAAAPGERPG